MTIWNGQEYREALCDVRAVNIDGELIEDVTNHPAFPNANASFPAMYGFQAHPAHRNLKTIPVGDDWRPIASGSCHDRTKASSSTAKRLRHGRLQNFGFLGSPPDRPASTLGRIMMGLDVFARGGRSRADAFATYFDRIPCEDLFVTYVIQNPQADQAVSASGQASDVMLKAEGVDDAGITVRGAKMLGTSTAMSDETLVGRIHSLSPGEEDDALSFAVPVAAPVILESRLLCVSKEAACNRTVRIRAHIRLGAGAQLLRMLPKSSR